MFNFFKKKTKKYATSGSIFPQINSNYIIDHLNILKLAKIDGEKNIPTSEANNLSYTESIIEGEIRKEILSSEKIFQEKKSLYESEILQLIGVNTEFEVTSCHHKVISDFKTTNQRWHGDIVQYKETKSELYNELQYFKNTNKLTRSAKYPPNRRGHIVVVIILMIIETIINGTFLAKGVDTGLVGGWITAFLFSIINLFLGGMCGYIGIRFITHNKLYYKLAGTLLFIVLTGLSICLNLLLTQYRDLSTLSQEVITLPEILSRIQESLLNFTDPMSPMVLIIATIFFIISLMDFYIIDDSYPGYGDIDRRYNKARIYFEKKKDEYISDIEERRNEALDEIKDAISKVQNTTQKQQEYIARLTNLPKIFISHINHLENVFIQSINIYRDINRNYRKENEPLYFSTKPTTSTNVDNLISEIDVFIKSIKIEKSNIDLAKLACDASKNIIDEYDQNQKFMSEYGI